VHDNAGPGLGEEIMRADGVAEEFADVSLSEAGCRGEVCKGGLGTHGECVSETEFGNSFGAGETGGMVGGHDVLARTEHQVSELEAIINDRLTRNYDVRVCFRREELLGCVEIERGLGQVARGEIIADSGGVVSNSSGQLYDGRGCHGQQLLGESFAFELF
jgi:hypothetical protein